MKIKAIFFLFLVTVLSNTYSMSVEDKNNQALTLGVLLNNKEDGEQIIESRVKQDLVVESCEKNGKFKFDQTGRHNSYREFLVANGYVKLDENPEVLDRKKHGGSTCLVCGEHLTRNWDNIHEHYPISHKFKVINDKKFYSFKKTKELPNKNINKNYERLKGGKIKCKKCDSYYFIMYKFDAHFNDKHRQDLNINNNNLEGDDEKKEELHDRKILPSFKDAFGEQNGSNDSRNINIGQGPEDKRRKLN